MRKEMGKSEVDGEVVGVGVGKEVEDRTKRWGRGEREGEGTKIL